VPPEQFMSKVFSLSVICLLAVVGGASVLAEQAPAVAPAPAPAPSAVGGPTAGGPTAGGPIDPRVALLKLLPAGSKLEDLKPSPIPGIYEFSQDADVSYLTADGKYFLDGNLYDMKSRENLTEVLRTRARVSMIAAVPESEMLIFSPPNPKYTITVFTDVDCQYCRKLHSEMAELNHLGVRVRYMFFPRTGPNTESWRKAEVVWCSANRNDALTRAKLGAALDMNKTCGPTPVAREYALGESIGVRGTPAIVTESGDYIAGYMAPKELVAQLKEFEGSKR
jgi:thiol:disulfide interchange protein DsbC